MDMLPALTKRQEQLEGQLDFMSRRRAARRHIDAFYNILTLYGPLSVWALRSSEAINSTLAHGLLASTRVDLPTQMLRIVWTGRGYGQDLLNS